MQTFLEATWSAEKLNEPRLEVMNKCNQTRINRGFSLIIDDSGHRKSGNFTAGVGRQYIGEIGKTDNGNVIVTSHLYDGQKSLPLDIELYQHAKSLPQGKKDRKFKKKPELARYDVCAIKALLIKHHVCRKRTIRNFRT